MLFLFQLILIRGVVTTRSALCFVKQIELVAGDFYLVF